MRSRAGDAVPGDLGIRRGRRAVDPPFVAFHNAAASNVPIETVQSLCPVTALGGQGFDTWNPQKSCPTPLGNGAPTIFVPQIGGWRDEPIDMNPDHSYCPTYVAINAKMAREMTTVNPATVLEIPYKNPVPGGSTRSTFESRRWTRAYRRSRRRYGVPEVNESKGRRERAHVRLFRPFTLRIASGALARPAGFVGRTEFQRRRAAQG